MGRYTIAFCTLVGAFFLPWWAVLLFAVYGAFRFSLFFEALIAGVIIDSMYATHTLFGIPGVATLTALVLIGCMAIIRRHVRYGTLSS